MELTPQQLNEIYEQVSSGSSLTEVLLNKFPDAEITVIKGYDNFSYESYVSRAYFSVSQAMKAMDELVRDGNQYKELKDTYQITIGKVADLMKLRISRGKTQEPLLDDTDKVMFYDSLLETLKERAKQ